MEQGYVWHTIRELIELEVKHLECSVCGFAYLCIIGLRQCIEQHTWIRSLDYFGLQNTTKSKNRIFTTSYICAASIVCGPKEGGVVVSKVD